MHAYLNYHLAHVRHGFYVVLLVLALLTPACVPRSRFLSGDPQATFVAHEANGILVVDRMLGGQPIAVRPNGRVGGRLQASAGYGAFTIRFATDLYTVGLAASFFGEASF